MHQGNLPPFPKIKSLNEFARRSLTPGPASQNTRLHRYLCKSIKEPPGNLNGDVISGSRLERIGNGSGEFDRQL
jgi:hypothetical protein